MNVWKKIGVSILFVVGGAVVGLLALVLVHCLPTDAIKHHLGQSQPMIEKDYIDTGVIDGNAATLTGNFTDCLMMEHSVYHSEEHSLLEQVLFMYRGESMEEDGWAPGLSLRDYLDDVEQPREVEYARYWHGYLVVLKPLFFLTTFNSVRTLAGILQFVLAGILLMLCMERKEKLLGVAFLVSLPCLYLFTMFYSLSLSVCYYIMAVAVIVQLMRHEKMEEKGNYYLFYLVVGMATSYFDFLTYPIVTLGYPLGVHLYLNRDSVRNKLKKFVVYSVQWSVGYLGLWAMKWILTDLLVGGNIIEDALNTLLGRTESAEGYSRLSGFFAVLGQSVAPYMNWGFYLLAAGMGITLFLLAIKNRKNVTKQTLLNGGVLLLVALVPIGWLFVTQNHVEQHWMYTFKILAVTVFAGVAAFGKVIGRGGNGND